ncbi:hypothetical protein GQ457_16G005830 [Hibiscus cannabinus]
MQRRNEELEGRIRLEDRENYSDSDVEEDELTIMRLGVEDPKINSHHFVVLQVAVEIRKLIRGPLAYGVTRVYLGEDYKEIQECANDFKPI